MNSISEKRRFQILENYFKEKGILGHQIDTFNDYVNNGIQRVVKESDIVVSNKDYKYTVSFGDVFIPTPSVIEEDRSVRNIYPDEARRRDLTYDSPIFVDVIEKLEIDKEEPDITHHRRIIIGRTPIMLQSDKCNLKNLHERDRIERGECSQDHGGYFIIRGKERVLVGQLRGIYNQPIVLSQKPDEKYKYICELRSMSEETGHSVLIQAKIGYDDRSINFSLPNIKDVIQVGIVFKAMGFTTDEEIKNIIGLYDEKTSKYIKYIIRDSYFISTQEDALKYIGQYSMHVIKDEKRVDYALQIVENELLPHMGISATIKEKAYLLGNMINKLIRTHVGLRNEDDRDNYINKRVEMAGVLCCDLFRALFKRFIKSIHIQLEKKKQHPDILNIISRTNSITVGLKHSFSTGNWGIQKNNYIRTGVSQVLSRMTHGAVISHLRRIVLPVGREGKNAKIRQIHSSQIMYICNCECFDPNTLILTWGGIVKYAKDITVGDVLIDDKGNQTKVKSTISGVSDMFTVTPVKKNNMAEYVVTSNHILTLKIMPYINCTKKYMIDGLFPFYEFRYFNKKLFEYQTKVCYTECEARSFYLSLDKDDLLDITISDYIKLSNEIKKCLYAARYKDMAIDKIDWGKSNIFQNEMQRSIITSNISVIEKGIGMFVGWQLEGNGRFLLSDFSIVHNTPEGQSIGIVLNLSLLTTVTRRIPTVVVKEIIENSENLIFINDYTLKNDKAKVFLNGILMGFAVDPYDFLDEMKIYRNDGLLHKDVSFTYDTLDNEIRVFSDEGRLIRPVFTVDDNNKLNITENDSPTWNYLVEKQLIQYVDNSEVENAVIAMDDHDLENFKANYQEIHPSAMLGVMASSIPFPDHTQSPRNIYQSSMGKQAIGVYALSHQLRTDTITHVLNYPQRPLVNTKMAGFLGFDDMPAGINAIVAIACYSGFNQEDSIIINKSAIDRGLFVTTSYRTLVDEEKKQGTYNYETIHLPPIDKRKRNANYSYLDERGIVRKRINGKQVFVTKDDVIIGKTLTKSNKNGEEEQFDCSFVIKHGEEGYIDRVIETVTPNGYKMIKVVIRNNKVPEIGDKFCSRAAQKGTLGMVYSHENMPFTQEGIVPDVILNPHAIPSRMTLNVLLETLLGKSCLIEGTFGDATPFTSNSVDIAEKLCDRLEKNGYDKYGWETLYSGFTGEPIEAKIYFGPTFYSRLKHMVSDKIHSRSMGHVTTLTRQPLEGRSREGGLRFGEMERDCMIAHGVSRFLKERLFEKSDPYTINICDNCGNIATSNTECRFCNEDKISKVGFPYAAKLLINELMAMQIKIKFSVKN